MESVLTTGYRSALILFSTLVVNGLILILLNPNNLLKGIALGLLIIGTIGHNTITVLFQSLSRRIEQNQHNTFNDRWV